MKIDACIEKNFPKEKANRKPNRKKKPREPLMSWERCLWYLENIPNPAFRTAMGEYWPLVKRKLVLSLKYHGLKDEDMPDILKDSRRKRRGVPSLLMNCS